MPVAETHNTDGKLIRQLAHMGFKEDFDVPKKAMNIPRYSMLVCGMFCSIAVSASYAFSLISTKLRDGYHFTQNDITTVSTVGIMVGYLTFPFGFIYDYIGPKPIFALGIIMNIIGTLFFAFVFDGTMSANVAGVSIINAILNLGCTLYDMGSVLTVLSWFPLDRGLVIACMKTATGLGSSIVSTVFSTYFTGNETAYMRFLMAYSIVIGILSIALIYLPPFHMTGRRANHYTEEERRKAADYESLYMHKKAPLKRFIVALTLLLSTLVVVTTRSFAFVYKANPSTTEKQVPTVLMVVLYVMLFLAVLPIKWLDAQPSFYDRENTDAHLQEMSAAGSDEPTAGAVEDDEEEDAKKAPHVVAAEVAQSPGADVADDDVSQLRTSKDVRRALRLAAETEKIAPQFLTGFFYNVRRPTLLCMWVVGFCTVGVVMVVTMNVTEIFIAISGDYQDNQSPALYVAITGIGSALGRLTMAFCEVGTVSKPADKRIPITVFYTVPPMMCLLACIFFLIIPAKGLALPMLLAGFANGFYAACEVITARTIFSIDISKHYNSLFFFEMLSLVFFNRLLFGELMTKNSVKKPDGSPVCDNRKNCIQTTFIVLTCLSAIASTAAVGIHLTYRAYARRQHMKRAEHRARLEELLATLEEEERRVTVAPFVN